VGPVSAYGLSKYVGEQYVKFFEEAFGLRAAIFRYGNVYGPRQDPKGEAGAVAIFTTQMLKGIQPTLYGDGNKTRDYIYVEDVVSANLLVFNGSGSAGIFNLGWGKEVTDFEVFEAIRGVLDVQVEPCYAPKRPGELDRISLESRKARAELHWTPRVSFEEGIRRSVDFYRQWSS
jgi:UDP-glucose 4-epimerase